MRFLSAVALALVMLWVPVDASGKDAEAVDLYRRAADGGLAAAQRNLGALYEDGEGVPRDYLLAYMWYNLAAAQGNVIAGRDRDDLEERLTREQIVEAQRMSTEWIAAHPDGN